MFGFNGEMIDSTGLSSKRFHHLINQHMRSHPLSQAKITVLEISYNQPIVDAAVREADAV